MPYSVDRAFEWIYFFELILLTNKNVIDKDYNMKCKRKYLQLMKICISSLSYFP